MCVHCEAMSSFSSDATSRKMQGGSRRAIDRGTARMAGRMKSRTISSESGGFAIRRHPWGNGKGRWPGSRVEFENVSILNDVRTFHHQTVVHVRSPEKACVPKVLGEVTMNMLSRILHGGAMP